METHTQATRIRIDALLLRWEDLRDQGRTIAAEELAGDTPELIPELAHRIAALCAVDAMLAPESAASHGIGCASNRSGVEVEPALDPGKAFSAVARMVEPRFHARGGLGQVLVARQEELDRRVALKRIRPDKLHPAARRRFIREAAITARLQHPGIVPIYGLGQDDDGPFYTMPFIEGRTLDEAIRQFHGDEAYRDDTGRRSVEFRRLLQRSVAVCETIAYAHDQGVVHRDLKPSNIMLGPYGETVVMDWGLAKRFAGDPSDSEADGEIRGPSPWSDDVTATGAVLGTPQYMSPEQAAGRPAGPASDIFSLGVILYAILTGKPPYVAEDRGGPNALGPVPEPSLVAPRVRDANLPRALEAVCLKAMAADPHQRYVSAGALAEDLTKWLADEPVTAHDEPWVARVRRWVRHHQRLVAGAAAAVLMAAAGLAVLTAEVSASNRRLAAARAEAEKERDQAKEVTEFLVSSFRKPNPEQEGSKVTVAEVLAGAVKELEGRSKMVPATRATLLGAVAQTYRGLGLVAETLEIAEKVFNIRRRESGEDHAQTLAAMSDVAMAYEEAGRLDDAIPLFERVLEVRQATLGADHSDTLVAMNALATAYDLAGRHDRSIPLHERALEAMRATLGIGHPRTIESMNNVALAYQEVGRFELAISLHAQALEADRATLGVDHPDTLIAMNNLALAYWNMGQAECAIPLHEQALAQQRVKLGEDHPGTLMTMSNLALDYQDVGQLDPAIALFEQVLKARRAGLGDDHPDTLTALSNLAMAYRDAGRLDRAIPLLERAWEAERTKRGDDHPDTLGTLDNLAAAYRDAGQLDRAIRFHEQVLRTQTVKLGADHPETLFTRRNLAQAYQEAGRHHNAELMFRGTVEAAGRAKPRNDRFYADSLAMLGRFLIAQQKSAEALPGLRECVAIREKGQSDDWSTAQARSLLGEALTGQRAYEEAEPLLLAAQKDLNERREKIRPLDRSAILRDSVDRLVRLYQSWNKPAEAEKWKKRLPMAEPSSASRAK